MGTKRRAYTDKFKAKVALDAVRGIKTLAELASEYQVHPTQISDWKKRLLDGSAELFSGRKSHSGRTEEELTAPLYEEIGRLKMDLKWLEKKTLGLPLASRRNWIEANRLYSFRRQCRLAGLSRSVTVVSAAVFVTPTPFIRR